MNFFGRNFKQLRLAEDYTQLDMAEQFKVSKSTISVWERGINYPEVATLIEIAEFFHVTTDYLLGNTDEYGNPTTPTTIQKPPLTTQERKLLDLYKDLTPDKQHEAIEIIKTLKALDRKGAAKPADDIIVPPGIIGHEHTYHIPARTGGPIDITIDAETDAKVTALLDEIDAKRKKDRK